MGFLDKLLGRGKKATGAAPDRADAMEDRTGQHEQMAQGEGDQPAQARAEQEES